MGLGTEANQDKKRKEKRTGVVVLPIVFYQPETRIGAGAGGLITHRAKGSSESARPSTLFFQAYYTQNKQYGIELKPEIYLKNEIYLINAYLKTSKFPSKFWGIGNQTLDKDEENYTPRMFNFDFSVQRRILPRDESCPENDFIWGFSTSLKTTKYLSLSLMGNLPKALLLDVKEAGCLHWDSSSIGTGGTIFFSPIQAIISR